MSIVFILSYPTCLEHYASPLVEPLRLCHVTCLGSIYIYLHAMPCTALPPIVNTINNTRTHTSHVSS